jgi:hypothetical protein
MPSNSVLTVSSGTINKALQQDKASRHKVTKTFMSTLLTKSIALTTLKDKKFISKTYKTSRQNNNANKTIHQAGSREGFGDRNIPKLK